MVHIRCAEHVSVTLLLQTMPGARANLVRTVTPVSAYRSHRRQAPAWLACRWRDRAIEAAHPLMQGCRASGWKVLPRSPETRRRIKHPMRPKFPHVQYWRRADAPGQLNVVFGHHRRADAAITPEACRPSPWEWQESFANHQLRDQILD